MGTSDFDGTAKGRAPAWCDRVLWSTSCAKHTTRVLMYDSCHNVVSSDHKPIKFLAVVRNPLFRRAGQPRKGDSGLEVAFPRRLNSFAD